LSKTPLPGQNSVSIPSFASGDDPAWADPGLDDGGWSLVHVPGDLTRQDVDRQPGLGWYRIRFIPDPRLAGLPLAVALGNVGNADQAFLNGRFIGGEGVIGDAFVEAPWPERLYPVPGELLRFDAENVLAVRILDTYRMAGIFAGPVCIGDARGLAVAGISQEFARKSMEIAFITLLGFFLLIAVFLHGRQALNPGYGAFTVFLALYLTLFGLESLHLYELGLKTPLIQRLVLALTCLLPAAGLLFLLNFYHRAIRPWSGFLLAAALVLALLLGYPWPLPAYFNLLDLAAALIGLTATAALVLAVDGVRRGVPESRAILSGFGALLTGLVVDFTPLAGHWHALPVQPTDLGMSVLVLTMVYALMARYGRTVQAVKTLSGRILEAHEDERRRLSRNLHDGLGQFLPALKLRLQMLRARVQAGQAIALAEMSELIAEVAAATTELRELITDVRPELLELTSLVDILRRHARLVSDKHGLAVHVRGPDARDLSVRHKDNLYRICQESLRNAVKHAAASQVEVEIRRSGKQLILRIVDDGQGFDPGHALPGKGVGLLSMRERAELLGGRFDLWSAPGQGCRIQVELEVP
jgi:signal transduction histidine kinase